MLENKNISYTVTVFLILTVLVCTATYVRNNIWMNQLLFWDDVVSKSMNDTRARNNFGGYLKESGYLDKALEEFMFVIEHSPDSYHPYNNVGLIYREKKEYSRALGYILKAIELKPNRFEMQYNVAVLYEELGMVDEAIFRYRAFLSIVPPAFEYQIKYALQHLKKLEEQKGLN